MGYLEIADALRDEGEGTGLDFKRDQYKVDRATDEEKGEFIKDVLAMGNAFRRTDGYIFIGAENVPGSRASIFGVADHIDDAKLQQLVNSKTNRTVEFIYVPLEIEGKKVALIHVPVQQRPLYLRKDFGKLRKEEVYFRRGSSTAIATPDEIARMGQPADAVRAPKLTAFLVVGEHNETVDKTISLQSTQLKIPPKSAFPSYGGDPSARFPSLASMSLGHKNKNYYYEYAVWKQERSGLASMSFSVKNAGNSMARDVRLVLTIDKTPEVVALKLDDDISPQPSASILDFNVAHMVRPDIRRDIELQATATGWKVVVALGKIQAMDDSVSQDSLYIVAANSTDVPIAAQIFADDLSQPVSEQLLVKLTVTEKTVSVNDLIEPQDKREKDRGM